MLSSNGLRIVEARAHLILDGHRILVARAVLDVHGLRVVEARAAHTLDGLRIVEARSALNAGGNSSTVELKHTVHAQLGEIRRLLEAVADLDGGAEA